MYSDVLVRERVGESVRPKNLVNSVFHKPIKEIYQIFVVDVYLGS